MLNQEGCATPRAVTAIWKHFILQTKPPWHIPFCLPHHDTSLRLFGALLNLQLVEQRSQLEERDALVNRTKEKIARQAKTQVHHTFSSVILCRSKLPSAFCCSETVLIGSAATTTVYETASIGSAAHDSMERAVQRACARNIHYSYRVFIKCYRGST